MILHRKGWRSLLFAPCLSFLLTHFIHAFENQKNCRDGECSSKEDSAESLIHRKVVVSELKKQVSEDNAKSIIYSPPTQHKEQDRKQSLIKTESFKKNIIQLWKTWVWCWKHVWSFWAKYNNSTTKNTPQSRFWDVAKAICSSAMVN